MLYVDNEALFQALSKPKEQSAFTLRRMLYISQFIYEIRLVKGRDNIVADALSRAESCAPTITTAVNSLLLRPQIDFEALFRAQSEDPVLGTLREDEFVKRKPKKIEGATHQVWVFETNAHIDLIYVPESQIEKVLGL